MSRHGHLPIISFLVITSILMPGCINQESSLALVSISTDKDLYHSREIMHINVTIDTSSFRENFTIVLQGLKSQKVNRGYQLTASTTLNLEEGRNVISFSETLPACSSCAGLYPGEYFVNISVFRDTKLLLTGSHVIEFDN